MSSIDNQPATNQAPTNEPSTNQPSAGPAGPTVTAPRRAATRWRGALDLLGTMRVPTATTRAEAARAVGMSSGTATEIVARLRELDLVEERPTRTGGRGRPTTSLHAHPRGPVGLLVDIQHERWRVAVVDLSGTIEVVAGDRHERREAGPVLDRLGAELTAVRRRLGHRCRVTSAAVAGTVRGHHVVQASTLGWSDTDLTPLGGDPERFLLDNDATLAGVAEARHPASAGATAVLYLTIEVGIGGVLVVDGVPGRGATGAGGELGHLPFGDRSLRCPCGARGCWDLEVDGRAMARHLGAPAPADPRTFGAEVLGRATADDAARAAVERCAVELGRGVGGLVNALDPDAVRLGGLAAPMLTVAGAAFTAGYHDGLMAFRRDEPPPVAPAATGDDGPLRGAAEVALDVVVSESGLEAWAAAADTRGD